jgi:hypothetical protein
MTALEAVQLRRLADDLLRQLEVGDFVRVIDVHDLSDGTWTVGFEDRWPDTRFPAFTLEVQQDWSREQAAHELRVALRDKLWICPLCQQRARIRRVVDMDVFRVDCARCGRFEIEHAVLDRFRLAYEEGDEKLVSVLPRLSGHIRNAGGMLSLGVDTWQAIAGAASQEDTEQSHRRDR